MYVLAKIFQASGLAIMSWGFFKSFPNLMHANIFLLAGGFFLIGWIIQSYLLKN